MVRTTQRILLLVLLLAASAALLFAQHDHAMAGQSQSSAGSEDMMKSCHKHAAETRAALDKLEKTITAGRESNDPAKMKAALEQAQSQLAEAKHHMSMCPMMSGGSMEHGDMQHMDHMKGMQMPSADEAKSPQ